jgi:hypothetical protein
MWSTVIIIALACMLVSYAAYKITHQPEAQDDSFPWGDKDQWYADHAASQAWAEEVQDELQMAADFEVEIAPAAVEGDPRRFVYVFLDGDEHEGQHFIFSEGEEDPSRIVCGYYEGDHQRQVTVVSTRTEMIDWYEQIVDLEELS